MNILKISIIFTFSAFLFAQASWGSTGIQEADNTDNFGYPLNFSYILKINTLEEPPSQEDIDDLLGNGTGTIQETFELARMGHVDSIIFLGDEHLAQEEPIEALKYYIWGYEKHWLTTGEHHLDLKEKIWG